MQPITLNSFASVLKYESAERVESFARSVQAFAKASSATSGGVSSVAIILNA